MWEKTTTIATPDGAMETFMARPAEQGCWPAVVIYMDFWGIREELRDVARRVAARGYCCILPDFYYRFGTVRNQFRGENGKMLSVSRLTPEQLELAAAPMRRLSDAMVVADTRAALDYLDAERTVRGGAVGSIGYCMGGRHVLAVAAAYPERFRASASLHGTFLVSDKEDSPHRVADRIRGELYCGFAENDPYCTAQDIQTLDSLLRGAEVSYRWAVHKGAAHGYALPDRDLYDERAAEADWRAIFEMFERQLPQTA